MRDNLPQEYHHVSKFKSIRDKFMQAETAKQEQTAGEKKPLKKETGEGRKRKKSQEGGDSWKHLRLKAERQETKVAGRRLEGDTGSL